mmetsp:Transcript_15293/g.17485  ORF Transcript_15293/g.17485 Transcript_15293/m.17485 type:complete len:503 (-) Transcript_15293:453-1961(-)
MGIPSSLLLFRLSLLPKSSMIIWSGLTQVTAFVNVDDTRRTSSTFTSTQSPNSVKRNASFCPSFFRTPKQQSLFESAAFSTQSKVSKEQSKLDEEGNGKSKSVSSTIYETPETDVYIEDTDAYGIVYNSNYVRVYDRALQFFQEMNRQEQDNNGVTTTSFSPNYDGDGLIFNNPYWSIVKFESKFLASPLLGDSYVVIGQSSLDDKPQSGINNDRITCWDMSMKQHIKENKEEGAEDDNITKQEAKIYNTAKLTIASPKEFQLIPKSNNDNYDKLVISSGLKNLAHDELWKIQSQNDDKQETPKSKNISRVTAEYTFHLYRDEVVDEMLPRGLGYIPLRSALNFFERSRSSFLGGPNMLEKLKNQDGVLFVVSKIEDCCVVFHDGHSSDNDFVENVKNCEIDDNDYSELNITNSNYHAKKTRVRTAFDVKRGGMVLECNHVLFVPKEDMEQRQQLRQDEKVEEYDSWKCVAQAKITLIAIDEKTKRPTQDLPIWLKDLFNIS